MNMKEQWSFDWDVSLELDLPATWEEYLAILTSKQRHEVRRKLRRLAEAGEVNYRVVNDNTAVPEAMDTFLKMFTESRTDKAAFRRDRHHRRARSDRGDRCRGQTPGSVRQCR